MKLGLLPAVVGGAAVDPGNVLSCFVVWHLRTPVKWGWYRADRIEQLPAG